MFAELLNFTHRQNRRFPVDIRALQKLLAAAGRLVTYNSPGRNYYTVKVMLGGVQQRVLKVSRPISEEISKIHCCSDEDDTIDTNATISELIVDKRKENRVCGEDALS